MKEGTVTTRVRVSNTTRGTGACKGEGSLGPLGNRRGRGSQVGQRRGEYRQGRARCAGSQAKTWGWGSHTGWRRRGNQGGRTAIKARLLKKPGHRAVIKAAGVNRRGGRLEGQKNAPAHQENRRGQGHFTGGRKTGAGPQGGPQSYQKGVKKGRPGLGKLQGGKKAVGFYRKGQPLGKLAQVKRGHGVWCTGQRGRKCRDHALGKMATVGNNCLTSRTPVCRSLKERMCVCACGG